MQDLPEGQTHHYEDDCNPLHQCPESDWERRVDKFFGEEIYVCKKCSHDKENHYWNGAGIPERSGYDACHVPKCECRVLSETCDVKKLPADERLKSFIASERKMAYQEGLAEWYIDESDGDLITLAEAITIDYANLSGRESANRAEFRERTLQRLQIYFNQLPILDTRNLELQNKRLLENNDILTKKIRAAKREAYEEAIGLSDKIELHYETEFNEWRAFKRFRNELRDRLASQQEPKD